MSDHSAWPGTVGLQAQLRVRMSSADAHYGGDLVDGARLLALFGDVATELCIRMSGDEGLFRAYESVEFLAPVHAGDYLEVEAEVIRVGNTSRGMRFEARKVIQALPEQSPSAAELLPMPIVVCRAVGTCVIPAVREGNVGTEPGVVDLGPERPASSPGLAGPRLLEMKTVSAARLGPEPKTEPGKTDATALPAARPPALRGASGPHGSSGPSASSGSSGSGGAFGPSGSSSGSSGPGGSSGSNDPTGPTGSAG